MIRDLFAGLGLTAFTFFAALAVAQDSPRFSDERRLPPAIPGESVPPPTQVPLYDGKPALVEEALRRAVEAQSQANREHTLRTEAQHRASEAEAAARREAEQREAAERRAAAAERQAAEAEAKLKGDSTLRAAAEEDARRRVDAAEGRAAEAEAKRRHEAEEHTAAETELRQHAAAAIQTLLKDLDKARREADDARQVAFDAQRRATEAEKKLSLRSNDGESADKRAHHDEGKSRVGSAEAPSQKRPASRSDREPSRSSSAGQERRAAEAEKKPSLRSNGGEGVARRTQHDEVKSRRIDSTEAPAQKRPASRPERERSRAPVAAQNPEPRKNPRVTVGRVEPSGDATPRRKHEDLPGRSALGARSRGISASDALAGGL